MARVRLKSDLFGDVHYLSDKDARARWHQLGLSTGSCPAEFSERNTTRSKPVWRLLARQLAAREAQLLQHLPLCDQLPQLLFWRGGVLLRSWIPGQPMQLAKPVDAAYFAAAHKLLRRLHRHNVVHNDLAKEPNWLVMPDGRPALIDYQLAVHRTSRNTLFRLLAKEDIRHLLKHKRSYRSDLLTSRELTILASPAVTSRVWMTTIKPIYLLISRKVLGWSDREGAGDRQL